MHMVDASEPRGQRKSLDVEDRLGKVFHLAEFPKHFDYGISLSLPQKVVETCQTCVAFYIAFAILGNERHVVDVRGTGSSDPIVDRFDKAIVCA